MTWDEVTTMPSSDFLAWLDRTYRAKVIRAVERSHRYYASGDPDEAWQELLLWAHNTAATAASWKNGGHVFAWAVGFVRRSIGYARRRAAMSSRHCHLPIGYGRLFTELTDAELAKLAVMPVEKPETNPGELGPSTGWLKQALDDLTPRRRRAIDLCIVGEQTVNQAADLVGCTKNAMNKARHLGLAQLRAAANGNACRTVGGYIVEEVA